MPSARPSSPAWAPGRTWSASSKLGDSSTLPAALQQALAATPATARPLAEVQAENQRINQLPDETQKQAARQTRNQAARQAHDDTVRVLLRRPRHGHRHRPWPWP